MTFKTIENKKFRQATIGGSFTVLQDLDNNFYVWGANTNGEMGIGDA